MISKRKHGKSINIKFKNTRDKIGHIQRKSIKKKAFLKGLRK